MLTSKITGFKKTDRENYIITDEVAKNENEVLKIKEMLDAIDVQYKEIEKYSKEYNKIKDFIEKNGFDLDNEKLKEIENNIKEKWNAIGDIFKKMGVL